MMTFACFSLLLDIRLTGQLDTPVPLWVSIANRFLIVTYCI